MYMYNKIFNIIILILYLKLFYTTPRVKSQNCYWVRWGCICLGAGILLREGVWGNTQIRVHSVVCSLVVILFAI